MMTSTLAKLIASFPPTVATTTLLSGSDNTVDTGGTTIGDPSIEELIVTISIFYDVTAVYDYFAPRQMQNTTLYQTH